MVFFAFLGGVFVFWAGCFRAARLFISRVARNSFGLFSFFLLNGAEQNGGIGDYRALEPSAQKTQRGERKKIVVLTKRFM